MIYERLFDIGLGMKRSERDNSSFTKMKPSKKLRASKQNSCLWFLWGAVSLSYKMVYRLHILMCIVKGRKLKNAIFEEKKNKF